MANKITKISDTELEIELAPEKYVLTKEHIEKRIAKFNSTIAEYEEMLKKF